MADDVPDASPRRATPPDIVEALLELRDEIVGIQAQLDELRARIDEVQRPARPRHFARIRSRVGRGRPASGLPPAPS